MKISTLGRELLQQNENRFHLSIRRSHALTDAIELLELATEKMFSKLKVTFLGEAGVDDGGLYLTYEKNGSNKIGENMIERRIFLAHAIYLPHPLHNSSVLVCTQPPVASPDG